jgi:hypothetical protein
MQSLRSRPAVPRAASSPAAFRPSVNLPPRDIMRPSPGAHAQALLAIYGPDSAREIASVNREITLPDPYWRRVLEELDHQREAS